MAAPDLTAVKAYLTSIGVDRTDTVVQDALTAETAAQARALKPGAVAADTMPADVAQALKRRVARNLAMRALTLGISADEAGATRLGSTDPEVRRLEKPYRRLVAG